jgi:hypothetical protein
MSDASRQQLKGCDTPCGLLDRCAALETDVAAVKADNERCQECSAELSACGEINPDGTPSLDCEVCQLRAEVERLTAIDAGTKMILENQRKEVKRLMEYCDSWGICTECGIKGGIHDAKCKAAEQKE